MHMSKCRITINKGIAHRTNSTIGNHANNHAGNLEVNGNHDNNHDISTSHLHLLQM